MIAIEAAVSPRHPSTTTAIEALGIQLRRHRNVRVGTDTVIIELPSIGNVLLTEHPRTAVIQAVVDDELGVKRFAVSILAELNASSPGCDVRDIFTLAWSRPEHAPALLR